MTEYLPAVRPTPRRARSRSAWSALLASIAISASVAPTQAAEIHVPGRYRTVVNALREASAGDTVVVRGGAALGVADGPETSLELADDVTLRGGRIRGRVRIRADGLRLERVAIRPGAELRLNGDGIAIERCSGTEFTSWVEGDGLRLVAFETTWVRPRARATVFDVTGDDLQIRGSRGRKIHVVVRGDRVVAERNRGPGFHLVGRGSDYVLQRNLWFRARLRVSGDRTVVTRNRFRDSSEIELVGADASVVGNSQRTRRATGVFLRVRGARAEVRGNRLAGPGVAIAVEAGGSTASIEDNRIDVGEFGLRCSGGTDIHTVRAAIRLNADVPGSRIERNRIRHLAGVAVAGTGPGIDVAENVVLAGPSAATHVRVVGDDARVVENDVRARASQAAPLPGHGIHVVGDRARVERNDVHGVAVDGVRIDGAHGNVRDAVLTDVGGHGVALLGPGHTVTDSRVRQASTDGVFVCGPDATIRSVAVASVGRFGICIEDGVAGTTISDSDVRRGAAGGIANFGSDTVLARSRSVDNRGPDIVDATGGITFTDAVFDTFSPGPTRTAESGPGLQE